MNIKRGKERIKEEIDIKEEVKYNEEIDFDNEEDEYNYEDMYDDNEEYKCIEEGNASVVSSWIDKVMNRIFFIAVIETLIAVFLLFIMSIIKYEGILYDINGIVFAVIWGITMLSFGVSALFNSIIAMPRKKKRCSEKVEAVIHDVYYVHSRGRYSTAYLFTIVYKYSYNGREYFVKTQKTDANREAFKKGDNKEIYINPNLPNEMFF